MNYCKPANVFLSLLLCSFLTACTNTAFFASLKLPKTSINQNTLEHKLLVVQIRSMLDQLMLMDDASSKNKNNIRLKKRRKTLNKQLIKQEKNLLRCSQYQKHKNLNLALDCANMAHKISKSVVSSNEYKSVLKIIADKARKKQVSHTAKTNRKRDSLMALAKKQILQPNHSATIKTLNQLLAIAPQDDEGKQLLEELKSIQEKHVIELITMGDQLYRDEKIEQAIAVWKAAKNLATNNKEVLLRIDRAEKVLDSVNKIKLTRMPAQ